MSTPREVRQKLLDLRTVVTVCSTDILPHPTHFVNRLCEFFWSPLPSPFSLVSLRPLYSYPITRGTTALQNDHFVGQATTKLVLLYNWRYIYIVPYFHHRR